MGKRPAMSHAAIGKESVTRDQEFLIRNAWKGNMHRLKTASLSAHRVGVKIAAGKNNSDSQVLDISGNLVVQCRGGGYGS